ncbi:hypothetical protein [Serratia plymuthica]
MMLSFRKCSPFIDHRITVEVRKATTARNLFDAGLHCFRNNNLASDCFIQQGQHVYIIPCLGDQTVNTLSALLIQRGFKAVSFVGVVEVEKTLLRKLSRR